MTTRVEERYFMMRPCRTSAAYFATLRKPLTLDLSEAATDLEAKGYRVTDCGVLLILHQEPEVTLYKSGRVLVKTGEERAAREAVKEVYEALGIVSPLQAQRPAG